MGVGITKALMALWALIAQFDNDGDVMTVLDVLAKDVGVLGVFSDWPATTTYYASCMGLAPSI